MPITPTTSRRLEDGRYTYTYRHGAVVTTHVCTAGQFACLPFVNEPLGDIYDPAQPTHRAPVVGVVYRYAGRHVQVVAVSDDHVVFLGSNGMEYARTRRGWDREAPTPAPMPMPMAGERRVVNGTTYTANGADTTGVDVGSRHIMPLPLWFSGTLVADRAPPTMDGPLPGRVYRLATPIHAVVVRSVGASGVFYDDLITGKRHLAGPEAWASMHPREVSL